MGPGISPLKESPPVTLSWYDIRAEAPAKQGFLARKINGCLGKEVKGPKQLLRGVSGVVQAGEMCAIMGARYEIDVNKTGKLENTFDVCLRSSSGAGKTTLMNILTHRRPGKLKITNDVRINGRKMKNDISGVSGFVQQEELFIGSMTIREHLRFHVSHIVASFCPSVEEFSLVDAASRKRIYQRRTR